MLVLAYLRGQVVPPGMPPIERSWSWRALEGLAAEMVEADPERATWWRTC